jgi:Domain of unknown function (DUF4158)
MPVEFVTADQQRRYGRYTEDPSPLPLARSVHFDDRDHQLLAQCQTDHTRLGLAVQPGTVRFLGTFLADPPDVPATVVASVAPPSGVRDLTRSAQYRSRDTQWGHVAKIRRAYESRDFSHPQGGFRSVRWLYPRAWRSAERPSVLSDFATARLVERKALLPGVTVLERLVARVRDRAALRLWHLLAQLPTPDPQARLETLLQVPEGARSSHFDRLRHAPTRVSGPALVAALQRLETIRALGVSGLPLAHLPPNRLRAFARSAAAARAQAIAQMTPERRLAALLAFAHRFESSAMDDALDPRDLVMTAVIHEAQTEGQHARLRTLRDLDAAALQRWEALQVLLDARIDAAAVRRQAFVQMPRARVVAAGARGEPLARPPRRPP